MKLSIVTVNLNNVNGLKKTIDSVMSQTFCDFEWIVIDGGSTDGSRELIERYSSHFSYWISEPDRGIYHAMNKGVEVSKGEYLQFLNSGDWLASETVLSDVFSAGISGQIIYGNIALFKENKFLKEISYPEKMSADYLYSGALGHNSCFIKKELLEKYPYDENLKIVSDWKFFFLSLLSGASFEHVNLCVGCFDRSGISSTNIDLRNFERAKVTGELAPSVLELKMAQTGQTQKNLARLPLDEFNYLCSRHRWLRKGINVLVRVMKRLDFFLLVFFLSY